MKKAFLFITIFISFLLFVNLVQASVTIDDPLNAGDFTILIGRITTAARDIVGGIAVIMLVIAGIHFLTSAGDPIKLQKAKDFVKYAIIGIIIAVTAEVIKDVVLYVLKGTTT